MQYLPKNNCTEKVIGAFFSRQFFAYYAVLEQTPNCRSTFRASSRMTASQPLCPKKLLICLQFNIEVLLRNGLQ
jgi:hypothetical protein